MTIMLEQKPSASLSVRIGTATQWMKMRLVYTIWLAYWVNQTNYSGAYAVWQYSEKGKVAGISGNVDLDTCTKDFPTIIKSKGLNGWGKSAAPAPTDDTPKNDTTVTATIKIGNDTYKGTLVKS